MQRFRKILLAVRDGTDNKAAIRRVERLARKSGAAVKVVKVAGDVLDNEELLSAPAYEMELYERMLDDKAAALDLVAQKLRALEINAESKLLRGKEFVETIREVLRGQHDLVITVADENETFTDALFGTTTMKLMRKCPCPVWVVKSTHTKPYGRILAAVDPAPLDNPENESLNLKILELAASLAKMEESNLHIVAAWQWHAERLLHHSIAPDEMELLVNERRVTYWGALDQLLKKVGVRGELCDVHLVKGEPAQVICELAAKEQVELIVMGTLARTGIPGLIMGNTAEEVLGRVDCSVLAVKPDGFVSPVELGT